MSPQMYLGLRCRAPSETGTTTVTYILYRTVQRQLDVGRLTVARMAPSELGAAAVVVTRAFAGTPEAQSLRDIRQAVSRAGFNAVSKAAVSLL